MKNSIRNLLLASCLLFAFSFDSCSSGVNYDNRYKNYPEIDDYSCTLTPVYGRRWMRLGFIAFSLGSAFAAAALITRHREIQNEDLRRSIFVITKSEKSQLKIE